jgi:hypothetical protein
MIEDSAATSFRQRRIKLFLSLLNPNAPNRVIDLGGTVSYWKGLDILAQYPQVHITVVNFADQEFDEGQISVRRGDATNLEYPDNSFDIVHSNSVLEHVGSWDQMRRMAREVMRVAPAHFVQTPNYWFPIEPHYKVPIVHWLPIEARIIALRALRKVPADRAKQLQSVNGIQLIGASQMKKLFPDSEIVPEKWHGLTKSLIAIKSSRSR